MSDFKATRHTFARPPKKVIADNKKGQVLLQMQYPSDLGQYKFLMQFSKYKFVSGREGNYEKVETSKSIAFPLPSNLSQDYTLNINSDIKIGGIQQQGVRALQTALEEGGNTDGIISTYFQGLLGSAEDGNIQGTDDAVGSGVKAGVKGVSNINSLVGSKMGAKGLMASKAVATIAPKNMVSAIEAGLGNIFNPVLAATFKGPNLRVHNFEWRVVPKNAKETATLNSIIRKIRKAIHPSMVGLINDDGNLAMEYPDICTCALLMPGTDQNIFYKPAMVSSFKVDHNEGGLAFFQKTGNPVSYKISMIMTELDVITREDFEMLEEGEGVAG